ncbi:MAG: UDP-N-acetylglucosamine--N-acetylmuramyl-(pentapeptide) pyrophosphoryl-undecaprenol N-acetylglucosamine transferase [Christensenellaceae bacterium]|nr:UDP-N-acetylglucosamine--N-acetylmuramyl-(pentapeptide) pyrophosphoryl-undecaprenol N-acetylglucosamine transferase [Christensenellaceae bacterium]
MNVIAITGGGTAGHVIPNLALIPELKPCFDKIIYLGWKSPENRLISLANIPFFSVRAAKYERQKFFTNLKIPGSLVIGITKALIILKRENVTIVFSKGGYVSLPVCIAAGLLRIPIVIHESDFSLGLASKVMAPFAKLIITSFPETKGDIYIGNPVRQEILNGKAEVIKSKYNFDNKPIVLIIGGSSGSRDINNAVYPIVKQLTIKYNIIHITGNDYTKIIQNGYVGISYSDNISDIYAASDIIVTRGGANCLSECAALGKRTLCIPLPRGRSRGDQIENAMSYKKRGCVRVLEQKDLTPSKLLMEIDATYYSNQPHATDSNVAPTIVKEILNIL